MTKTIHLSVTHPAKLPGPIEGFSSLWAFYVRGFNPAAHCQRCFHGARAPDFNMVSAGSGAEIVFDRMDAFPYLYICGVGAGKKDERRRTNLHFPLMYADGAVANATTDKGYRFVAENAIEVPIPELSEGWNGLPREHHRCKNFQFGVAYFGASGTVGSRGDEQSGR